MYSGLFSYFLQDLRRVAGTPSAPAAELFLSSLQALSMSLSVNSMSDKVSAVLLVVLKKVGGSCTLHSGLGLTNTELYCLLSWLAEKSGLGFG